MTPKTYFSLAKEMNEHFWYKQASPTRPTKFVFDAPKGHWSNAVFDKVVAVQNPDVYGLRPVSELRIEDVSSLLDALLELDPETHHKKSEFAALTKVDTEDSFGELAEAVAEYEDIADEVLHNDQLEGTFRYIRRDTQQIGKTYVLLHDLRERILFVLLGRLLDAFEEVLDDE